MEQFVCAEAHQRPARTFNLPRKNQRIAVVGTDLDGLALALRFSQRNYPVTVYEQGSRIGESLYDLLPEASLEAEIEQQFAATSCRFVLDTDFGTLEPFDVMFVCARYRDVIPAALGVFYGSEDDPVFALSEGITFVNRIEGFLKTGVLSAVEQVSEQSNTPDQTLFIDIPAPEIVGGQFTTETLKLEAQRCALCDCDSCYRRCALMQVYKRFPKPLMRDVSMTVTPTDLVQKHVATRLIASCSQCGSCTNACPLGLDIRSLIMDARRALVRRGEMPPAFHAFWLADFAHSDCNSLVRFAPTNSTGSGEIDDSPVGAPGDSTARYAFFPGCQLGASDPRYVVEAYRRLLVFDSDCSILLTCCGAPLFWAGLEDEQADKNTALVDDWERLGRPTLITACPTCAEMLTRSLPQAQTVSLYTLPLGTFATAGKGCFVSVFDPCAARHDVGSQDAIRQALLTAGYQLDPLAHERLDALCCGWGGQYQIVNPQLSQHVSTTCEELSNNPYVTWCANCRDTFAADGKEAWHFLDLLCGLNNGPLREPPTVSQRRRNREALVAVLVREFWPCEIPDILSSIATPRRVLIDEAIAKQLSQDWILESDAEEAVLACEASGNRFLNEETGAFVGYQRLGTITLWVEYRFDGEACRLTNAYAHRMNILT
jgi:Fe-S oxidoreductase